MLESVPRVEAQTGELQVSRSLEERPRNTSYQTNTVASERNVINDRRWLGISPNKCHAEKVQLKMLDSRSLSRRRGPLTPKPLMCHCDWPARHRQGHNAAHTQEGPTHDPVQHGLRPRIRVCKDLLIPGVVWRGCSVGVGAGITKLFMLFYIYDTGFRSRTNERTGKGQINPRTTTSTQHCLAQV
jgi:hypothetical protein